MTNQTAMSGYTDAINGLPTEAFLGSLLFFTITQADVNLTQARQELEGVGLSTATLRKNLRPVDAFNKAAREFAHKFRPENGIRSEILVRPVGADGAQVHRHIILERTVLKEGQRRRLAYDKVGELIFTRGEKKKGEYSGYEVRARQTTELVATPMSEDVEGWLTSRLETFQSRFDHLLHYMDSHAVRTFVREYVYSLSGVCVRESGGLYFIKQAHADEVAKLQSWVQSIGSEFHTLPLLNLTDQREMIMQAFEEETIAEVNRLMGEVKTILSDPNRSIEAKTFDAYGVRAAELSAKVREYNDMLDARSDRAKIEIDMFSQQVLTLASRIRTPLTKVKVATS